MKKLLCLILCLTMCLSLCSCIKVVVDKGEDDASVSPATDAAGKKDDKKTEGKKGETSGTAPEKELWEKLSGIWMYQDIDGYYFTEFGKDSGGYYLSQGIPASEYMFGGYVTSFEENGDACQFVIEVPAAESTEEYEGHDAYSLVYYCEVQADGTILLTNNAGDGSYVEWVFSCRDWDSFDWDAFFNDNSGVSLDTAWNVLKGVWTAKDSDGTTWFDVFGIDGNQAFLSTGIPYSGYGIYGKVTGFEDRTYDSTWWVNLHFDAVPASEENSGSAAFDVLIMVDYSQLPAEKIDVTNIAGDGKVLTFEYRCETLDQLPLD